MIRFSHPHLSGGFRVPFNIGRFPVLPALGIASCLWFISMFDKKFFLGFLLFMFVGVILYILLWERKHEHILHTHGDKYPGQLQNEPVEEVAVKEAHILHAPIKVKRSRKVKKRK
jgi:hypothetical protein